MTTWTLFERDFLFPRPCSPRQRKVIHKGKNPLFQFLSTVGRWITGRLRGIICGQNADIVPSGGTHHKYTKKGVDKGYPHYPHSYPPFLVQKPLILLIIRVFPPKKAVDNPSYPPKLSTKVIHSGYYPQSLQFINIFATIQKYAAGWGVTVCPARGQTFFANRPKRNGEPHGTVPRRKGHRLYGSVA